MRIFSIDVGLENFAFVYVELQEDGSIKVTSLGRIDLKRYVDCNCNLYHSPHIADLMEHLVVEYKDQLHEANLILVEKQPPTGFVAIEQFIFSRFRSKVQLMQPRSMHAHFGIGHLDRDHRKQKTVEIANEYLGALPEYQVLGRQHDVADAMCFVLFYRFLVMSKKNVRAFKSNLECYVYVEDGDVEEEEDCK